MVIDFSLSPTGSNYSESFNAKIYLPVQLFFQETLGSWKQFIKCL